VNVVASAGPPGGAGSLTGGAANAGTGGTGDPGTGFGAQGAFSGVLATPAAHGAATRPRGQLEYEYDVGPAPLAVTRSSALDLDLRIDPQVAVPVGSWALATAFGVILFAAITGRGGSRERRLMGPLTVAASVGVPAVATPAHSDPSGPAEASPTTGRRVADGDAPDSEEANLPRWLRPTLREQRRSGNRP